ncbi:MAG TPA: glutamine--tRNA ligase/YqeY domain fusion protein [Candidatus Thiothrix moscowensis]|uniref:glutamine--tRNA ligase/YqeY domain fusion protein n=1 Tax=unclassified Thiothrix TaxID=2636184 RepID=UPI0025CE5F87|nr:MULTISPECIES: glutamine--tRNA ligase/YqeY domain fusion protein [unclassified Thiothrix]HRJ54521.1 glutamine--tRNA ligase/YqeY domain fusion protein [Candidatus Thiothrix moscowensis]HRJ94880.1 glutamine--tRNA ligase/YqeY domain fusion protein [Candidatus Thiothrix moscowensis]
MSETSRPLNFIERIIEEDLKSGKVNTIHTRFPPEPNGYLHVGHAKSIWLNFGLAQRYGGTCNLRMDDTNPEKEDEEYVESIKADVQWLGYQWDGEVRYASDYFDQLYDWAVYLIQQGKAFVCDLNAEEMRQYRGTLNEAGKESPFRTRSIEENLDLFERMRAGEFADGSRTLRAKIDMASPNINLRDPVLYRIKKATHHQTGDKWCIYPSYDYTHGQSDALEYISHSICTLEFEDHRPLYDWCIQNLPVPAEPHQYEFSRLNLNYTVTSKRRLKQLVVENHVDGWNDPRMPTISGMRRRGYTPKAIRNFCEMAGVTKVEGVVDLSMLEHAIRDDLNEISPRAMCVLHPLKVTLTNYPDDKVETMTAPVHPQNEAMGTREMPFCCEILIDQDDFREEANKQYKRLVLGKRVRLRNSYVIEADAAIKDADGNVIEVRARVIENTVGKDPADGVKAKGVIHWVSARENVDCEVRLYDRLFNDPAPDAGGKNYLEFINPHSLEILQGCKGEIGLANATLDDRYQFEREGYFVLDSKYSTPEKPVFNRVIGLKDTWEKAAS